MAGKPNSKVIIFLLAGIIVSLITQISYYSSGYSARILVFILTSIILVGAYFFIHGKKISKKEKIFSKKDLISIALLLLIFAPIYLSFIYIAPWQINTDEITIMEVSRQIANQEFQDPLGTSDYFGFPTFIFLVWGTLGKMLGGVTLLNMRVIHAVSGIIIILLAYLFFKVAIQNTLLSFGGAVILGSNHALVAISRMAMRDNTGLLIELAALTLLLIGLKRRSGLYSFIGGMATGLTFYTYYPVRITIFIWGLALLLIAVFFRKKFKFDEIVKIGLINLLGFIMIATPILIATTKSPNSTSYQKEQFLIFEEGQKLEQRWTGESNTKDAIIKNIKNGIATFNSKITDQGYIYPNPGHGFVNPFTGILIWLGLITILFKLKRRKKESDILSIAGFLSLWLIFAFLITKSPNYTRLLTILPFLAYLALHGLKTIASLIAWPAKKKLKLQKIVFRSIFLLGLATILIWNLLIFSDFIRIGLDQGNDVGSTARYIEQRKNISGYNFYLAADKNYQYYSWGEDYQWKTWLGFFVQPHQNSGVVNPDLFISKLSSPPFTIFMNENLWEKSETDLRIKYPNLRVNFMKTNGSLLAIEVK